MPKMFTKKKLTRLAIHDVSGWAFHKLKQNERNIDMYISTISVIYTILSDLEE